MQFEIQQHKTDPDFYELYSQWNNKPMLVCQIHTDCLDDQDLKNEVTANGYAQVELAMVGGD